MGFFDGLAGSLVSGVSSIFGGERANDANAKAAASNTAFQERMRNTQYQAAMADMKKAGLNPMLAYQQGGAAVPSGSVPTINDTITPAVNSARQSAIAAQEFDKIEAETKNLQAATETQKTLSKYQEALRSKTITDTITSALQGDREISQTKLFDSQREKNIVDTMISAANVNTAKTAAQQSALDLQRSSRFGDSVIGKEIEGFFRTLGTAKDYYKNNNVKEDAKSLWNAIKNYFDITR